MTLRDADDYDFLRLYTGSTYDAEGGWFYDFFKEAYTKLSVGGAFMMEGHEDTLLDLEEMALKFFTKCEIKMDYTKRRRFLYCYKDK